MLINAKELRMKVEDVKHSNFYVNLQLLNKKLPSLLDVSFFFSTFAELIAFTRLIR